MMQTWKNYSLPLLLVLVLAGFGCSDGGVRSAGNDFTVVSGGVVQGPVSDALIIADKNGNYLLDGDETSTRTDANGDFNDLVIPDGYGPYVLVSIGGIDTITELPALPMLAPAGARHITPITTLVALAPEAERAALIADLDALSGEGNGYDSDPSVGAKADFVSLVKVVEAILYLMQDLGVTETSDQLLVARHVSSQLIADQAIATAVATPGATMSASVQQGVVKALPYLVASSTTDFSINPGNATDFGAVVKAVAVEVESVVAAAAVNGNVTETKALHDAVPGVDTIIANDTTGTLVPIRNFATLVTLGLDAVTLLDAAGLETTSAGAATRVRVVLDAFNNTLAAKNYANVSLTLAVRDRASLRSVTFNLTGVALSATAAADLSVLSVDLNNAALSVAATKSDGTQISTNSVNGAFGIFDANFAGNELLLNLNEVQTLFADQVAAEFASVSVVGDYRITLQATGAPIASAAKIVTIVP